MESCWVFEEIVHINRGETVLHGVA